MQTLPLGAELTNLREDPNPNPPPAPAGGGAAPWLRKGANHVAPTSEQAKNQAEKWKAANGVETREERRARRAKEREELRKKNEEERREKMEERAKQMYLVGFFGLPLIWIVALWYFREDVKREDVSEDMKKCK